MSVIPGSPPSSSSSSGTTDRGASTGDGSDGVPMIAGEWTGKITSVYWNQTSAGAVRPKQKYKSKLDGSIDQKGGAILIGLTFDSLFPVDTGGGTSTVTLNGNVGNYHLGAAST